MSSGCVIACLLALVACSHKASSTDASAGNDATPVAVTIWPESGGNSDVIGVYVQVFGGIGDTLELQSFDGALCAVGNEESGSDAGVGGMAAAQMMDAGTATPSCPDHARYMVQKSPQTFAAVFELPMGTPSGLLTATLLDSQNDILTTVWRRVYRSAAMPDAGAVDASNGDSKPAMDATPMTDSTAKDAATAADAAPGDAP